MATNPRIYVASLADYNAGHLHGTWIDANQDADAIRDEIATMLRGSPHPNVMVACPELGLSFECPRKSDNTPCDTCKGTGKVPSAEEYAIHDYEGFGKVKISEYETIDTVAELAKLIEEHDGAFEVAYANFSRLDEAKDAVTNKYEGAWDSLEDYAENFLEDTGQLREIPENLRAYFDFEKFARDLKLGGDVWTGRDSSGQLHVFHNA
jgi:antirestriction protein